MTKKMLFVIVLLAAAAYYFSGVGFEFDGVEKAVTALVTLAFLYFAGKTGWQRFYLVVLTTVTTALSLGCAFLTTAQGTGPFVWDLQLNPIIIILSSVLLGSFVLVWYEKSKNKSKFALILLSVFVLNWIILAFNVRFYDDWKMENWLTVPFVVIIYVTQRWFRLSNASYGLIFAYMMLHIYGSHYTYAEVPFGFWMQDYLDMARNHYDRVVHFSFGLLLAYPIREMSIRITDAKGFWAFWIPVEFVLAFSALYEIIEWVIAIVFGGDLGIAYLGTQGDVWDAQWDMFLAGFGAVLAMTSVLIILWYFRRARFWKEFRDSLRIKQTKALGDEALKELMG